MPWLFPLIFNIIFSSIRNILDKRLVDRINPFVVFLYVSVFGQVIVLLVYFLRHASLPAFYPEMMFLGALYSLIVGTYLYAIKINLTQTAVFTSYYLLIPMLLSAIFMGEWIYFDVRIPEGQRTIMGIILALISMFLLLHSKSKKEEKMEKTWFLLIGANILLNGIGTFWGKSFIGDHGALETMFSQGMGGIPVILIFLLIQKEKLKLSRSNLFLTFVDSVIVSGQIIFYYAMVKAGPLAIILPVQTLVLTLAVVLIGLFIYNEAHFFTKAKFLGLIAGVVGVVLLMV